MASPDQNEAPHYLLIFGLALLALLMTFAWWSQLQTSEEFESRNSILQGQVAEVDRARVIRISVYADTLRSLIRQLKSLGVVPSVSFEEALDRLQRAESSDSSGFNDQERSPVVTDRGQDESSSPTTSEKSSTTIPSSSTSSSTTTTMDDICSLVHDDAKENCDELINFWDPIPLSQIQSACGGCLLFGVGFLGYW